MADISAQQLLTPNDPVNPSFRAALDAAMAEQLDRVTARLRQISSHPVQMVDIARQLLAGGKRIRPAFVLWGQLAVCGRPAELGPDELAALIRACAAFEFLHGGVLVHDDLIDDSDTRRGVPAAHRAFQAPAVQSAALQAKAFQSEHAQQAGTYGRAQAVILGDEIISWADETLFSADLPPQRLTAALPIWWQVRTEVNAGQYLDIANQYGALSDLDPLSAARLVLETKTSKYTVVRPLQFGAALAGASPELLLAFADFGGPLGRAFQLRDDLLGVFADPVQTGKPAGDDLREGKATVLIAHALQRSPHAAELAALIGDRDLDEAQLARARELITQSGAVQAVEDEIAANWQLAQDRLAELPINEIGRAALTKLAELAVQRTT